MGISNIPQEITAFKKHSDIGSTELASMLGISESHLWLIESGEKNYSDGVAYSFLIVKRDNYKYADRRYRILDDVSEGICFNYTNNKYEVFKLDKRSCWLYVGTTNTYKRAIFMQGPSKFKTDICKNKCLRCDRIFTAASKFNKICNMCKKINSSIEA